MIGLSHTGQVRAFGPQKRERWILLAGVHLGIAYQIVPLRDRNGWRWTFYPPIGDGASRSGEHFGESADAERACRNAIGKFARAASPRRYLCDAMLAPCYK